MRSYDNEVDVHDDPKTFSTRHEKMIMFKRALAQLLVPAPFIGTTPWQDPGEACY